MNILVLGATGGTGRQVVTQALDQGHNVTALVRDARRLPIKSDRLHVVGGDVTAIGPTLSDVVLGQDAVISTLGVGKSFEPRNLIVESTPLIIRAMESQGVRRLIHTSAFGVGETYEQIPFVPRLFVRTLLRHVYRDKLMGVEYIRRCDLDWTIVYPVGLTDAPKSGTYRVGERVRLRGFPTISRADVASFLVAQVTDRTYVGKGVLIAD